MTKHNDYPVPLPKTWMENIEYSPYYSVAIQMLKRRDKYNPTSMFFIADLFDCFHEIAKIDNKINKGEK